MKFLSLLPVAAFPLIAAFGNAQDASTMETGIPGLIADGAHRSPAPKQEPIGFEAIRTLTKRVHVGESPEMPGLPVPEGTINVTVTVQLVNDSGLHDPPSPPPVLPPDDPAVLARLAELSKRYRETQLVFVSATVYDHSHTFLRCCPSGNGHKDGRSLARQGQSL